MKRALQLVIGAGVYVCWRLLCPARLAAVREQFFASHHLSFLERQLIAFTLFTTPMDTRTASSCWAGGAGGRFHADDNHRLTLAAVAADTFYRRPMLDEFAARAATGLRPGASIVEVGCGAGGNLLYLRECLAGHDFRFLGFDVNEEVISSNRQQQRDDMAFAVRDCFTTEIAVPGDLGLIFCAVLMYAQEQDIERLLLGVIGNCPGRILLGLSEPVLDPDAARALPHNNLALAHGYRRILRRLGFRELCASLRREGDKPSRIYHAVFELLR